MSRCCFLLMMNGQVLAQSECSPLCDISSSVIAKVKTLWQVPDQISFLRLQRLLSETKSCVQMMNILEQLCQQLLGPNAVERVDASSPSAQLHEAVLRFNAPGRSSPLVLQTCKMQLCTR